MNTSQRAPPWPPVACNQRCSEAAQAGPARVHGGAGRTASSVDDGRKWKGRPTQSRPPPIVLVMSAGLFAGSDPGRQPGAGQRIGDQLVMSEPDEERPLITPAVHPRRAGHTAYVDLMPASADGDAGGGVDNEPA